MKIKKTNNFNIQKNYDVHYSHSYNIEYQSLSALTSVEHFTGNFFAVDMTITTQETGMRQHTTTEKWQKIITDGHLEALLDNPHDYKNLEKTHAVDNAVLMVKPEFLMFFSKYGYQDYLSKLDGEVHIKLSDYSSTNFLTEYRDYQFIQFVKNDNFLYIWRDSNGVKYTPPVHLDYIRAKLDNGSYQLEPLIEHLAQRSDVAFITQGTYNQEPKILYCPLTGNEAGMQDIINDIGGHNAEPGRDECINLLYYPTGENLDKLQHWALERDTAPNIYNKEMFIVKELLQCEAFAYPEMVEPVVPQRKFKRS